MSLNGKQIISILMAILGAVIVSSAQLSPLIGPNATNLVVSISGLTNTILAAVMANITNQTHQVTDVAAMPGVDRISVNKSATPELAAVATDPMQPKVGATSSQVRTQLMQSAKS